MSNREAFEKYYRKSLDVDANFNRNDNLQYRSAYVQFAWVVWQAALQSGEAVGQIYHTADGARDVDWFSSTIADGTLLYTTPQPVVDDGCVLVPIEPTEAMLEAFMGRAVKYGWELEVDSPRDGYKALLSAAKESVK